MRCPILRLRLHGAKELVSRARSPRFASVRMIFVVWIPITHKSQVIWIVMVRWYAFDACAIINDCL